MSSWPELMEELDAWGQDDRTAELWWRDDDADPGSMTAGGRGWARRWSCHPRGESAAAGFPSGLALRSRRSIVSVWTPMGQPVAPRLVPDTS